MCSFALQALAAGAKKRHFLLFPPIQRLFEKIEIFRRRQYPASGRRFLHLSDAIRKIGDVPLASRNSRVEIQHRRHTNDRRRFCVDADQVDL